LELLWNMYGTFFWKFWTGPGWAWNWFDFLVVMISVLALILPDLPGITVLRLFRAFRVGRLFKRIPSLRRIIEGVLLAIPSLAQVFCVLFILMGIWSVIGVEYFQKVAPKEFGDFGKAMYTMFVVMMLEFPDISDPIIFDHGMPLAVVFFVSYVFIAGIVMTNVVVAVLIDKYLAHHEDPEAQEKQKQIDELTFPTLYINRDGVMQPLRSITYSQYKKVQDLLDTFEPPKKAMASESLPGFSDRPLKQWSQRRVARWLEAINFGEYKSNFKKEKVDGPTLASITEYDLHCLGMRIGDRKRFLQHLHSLYSEQLLRDKKKEDMRRTFLQYDLDNSGKLDVEEFTQAWLSHTTTKYSRLDSGKLMRTLSLAPSKIEAIENQRKQDAENIFRGLDIDGNGEVDFEEFCQAWDKFSMLATEHEDDEAVTPATPQSELEEAAFYMSGMDITIDSPEVTLSGGGVIFSKGSSDDTNQISDPSIELTSADENPVSSIELTTATNPARTPPESTKVEKVDDLILPSVSNTYYV